MNKLKKIPKEVILNSSLWKPPDKPLEYSRPTDSWFNINQMYLPQSNSVRIAYTQNIRTYPIHLRPSMKQRHKLLAWNEVYRRVYNLSVSYLKGNKLPSFITLRKIIDEKIEQNRNLSSLSKKSGIPKHTRDNAVKDCIKAYKTAFANLKAKNIKYFKIRYKRKGHHLSSIVLENSLFSKKENAFAVKTLGTMNSDIPFKNITKECRLCYNSRTKLFTLRVPYDKVTHQMVLSRKTAALDPGEAVFQTVYTPDKNCYEICSRATNKQLYSITDRIENVNKKDKNYPKYLARLRERLANKTKDMHYKTCNFLCKNFDVILVGNLSTKQITSKKLSLPKRVKKGCLNLAHYAFRQRLISKAEEYGNKVVIVDESYTSKTCGNCGELNTNLGPSRTFWCDHCSFTCGRDTNAARNIYLKNVR